MLQVQQGQHHHQQHGGQLGRRQAVVHGQPGFVDAGGEGLNAKVAGHAEVGQGLHQHQRHACSHGRAGQGQGHRPDAARQRGTQQPRCLHELRRTLTQSCAGQQVHIGVEREDEHPHRPTQAAHFRQQAAFQAKHVAQAHLKGAAELQKVGVRIGRDIRGHGQRQQQQPFKRAPPRKIKQRDRRRSSGAHQGCAQGHHHTQPQGGAHIARQHRGRHLAQDAARLGVALPPREPGRQHRQYGQGKHARQQNQGQGTESEGAAAQDGQSMEADGTQRQGATRQGGTALARRGGWDANANFKHSPPRMAGCS